MEVFMTAVKSPPNRIRQKKCPKNKMSTTSAKSPSNTTSIDISKAQFLDGRPIAIYKGPDQLLWTTRDEIVKIVDNKQNASRILKKAQKQMNALFENVSSWVEQHKKQIAGFGGSWRIEKCVENSELPCIISNFVIVQAENNAIDEPLWMDLADFDVQIANDPEFSNVRMNIMPMPFIEQDVLLEYIQKHLK
jgi:hypothetical protein